MCKKVIYVTYTITLLIWSTVAFPSRATTKEPPPQLALMRQMQEVQFLQPGIITIQHFEALLKRAGELFHPSTASQPTELDEPQQQMQPPTAQPYNFYLPLYQLDDNTKLDPKSRRMELITPPAANDQLNYYSIKPKKLPKKFDAAAKHINVKWLNAFEREALSENGVELPKAVYLLNDEQQRINFDNSFFGADMGVQSPDNQPHKLRQSNGHQDQDADDEISGEDLVASPTVHVQRLVKKRTS